MFVEYEASYSTAVLRYNLGNERKDLKLIGGIWNLVLEKNDVEG